MSNILTVSELTRSVKNLLEAEFPFVWVRGEVSNLARPASGHVYFTLTDGDAALSVVWFKSSQKSARPVDQGGERVNPLTGEIEEEHGATALTGSGIEDGMEVLCAGRLNVYEPRGQYQLVAELVQDQGVGDLAVAFEALKKKLAEKGYFDEDRKIALPRDPKRVAVVTSRSGAAIRDFLRIADTRGTGSEIRIYPTLVQGDRASEQIAAALDQVDADDWAEVIVLIRGGGSLEDLWAFNTEPVADAIFRARLPVITGVGHEPDMSIADFVADKRAATPSHTAQEIWPRREVLAQGLDVLDMHLGRAYANWLQGKNTHFEHLRKALVWLSPERRLERMEDMFSSLMSRLQGAGLDHYYEAVGETVRTSKRLNRAFGVGRVDVEGRTLSTLMHRMERAFGPDELEDAVSDLGIMARRLEQGMERTHADKVRAFELAQAALKGLDPEGPLERGYALVQLKGDGSFLRDPKQVAEGDALDIRVKHGHVAATVSKERKHDA
ncbi:exodeoxyribonuclease VII large subunit [Pseudodesulfovibrio sediminis]|uniref:Exodeoxyribonuclease 7 large subunit n=1 Tax=Pseudodesulfovibrio sediminis TaxID=2810563 RepID=A0ABM7P646_9BACT|nr:exodeoxyribonuclease VII large subunit [Pseudodesulfovibrio sediminis]BCS88398.1 exodeoxyribonuclease 7 large subunit [Pseudodesulfovibrio sediminis]